MITGGCLCGAVRFRVASAPISARICWCKLCQKLGAGSGTVNAVFERQGLTFEGDLTDYESVADSGNRMHRRFCRSCGTPVFSESEATPHLVLIRVGALDDPEVARPASTIWVDSAPTWACIDPSLPLIDRQPPPIT